MNYKLLAVLAITVVFIYELVLEILDRRSRSNPIPENVADIYDRETYLKWRDYQGEKSRVSLIHTIVSTAVCLALLIFNVYAAFARLFPKGDFMQMFSVILLSALTDLLLLPLAWYDTMVVEEKYGFNRTSKKTFFLDAVKEFIIPLGILTLVGLLLMVTYKALGDWMIVVFAAVMMIFILAVVLLYPILSKIFNKFTPLEEGELKERLTELLEKHGYTVRAINVMDGSRRSTKSNAYFTGFGKMKTIVLYDTLIANMSTDEICAVFAHEMGHGLHKDTLKNQFLTALQILILAVLAWLTLRTPAVFTAFGFDKINYGFALIMIMSVEYALLSPLMTFVANVLSRKAEFRADEQAVREGYGEFLISALKKLAKENFADLSPDPLLVKLSYSHPPISERIAAIETEIKKSGDR